MQEHLPLDPEAVRAAQDAGSACLFLPDRTDAQPNLARICHVSSEIPNQKAHTIICH